MPIFKIKKFLALGSLALKCFLFFSILLLPLEFFIGLLFTESLRCSRHWTSDWIIFNSLSCFHYHNLFLSLLLFIVHSPLHWLLPNSADSLPPARMTFFFLTNQIETPWKSDFRVALLDLSFWPLPLLNWDATIIIWRTWLSVVVKPTGVWIQAFAFYFLCELKNLISFSEIHISCLSNAGLWGSNENCGMQFVLWCYFLFPF